MRFVSVSLAFFDSRSVSSSSYLSQSSTLMMMRRFGFWRIAFGIAERTAFSFLSIVSAFDTSTST